MEYVPPINGNLSDPDRAYINANPGLGVEGSIPPGAAFEHVQREIINAIEAAGLTPNGADLTQLTQAIVALAPVTPAGVMFFWPSLTIPTGYLVRNGAAISRTSYAALFSVLGTTYGAGDGVTTFNLMDDRGEFLRGLDLGRGVDTGRALGSFQADELKSHLHTQTYNNTNPQTTIGPGPGFAPGSSGTGSGNLNTLATGGSETRPRNKAYVPIIKF